MPDGKKGLAEIASEALILTVMVAVGIIMAYLFNSWGIYDRAGLEKETDLTVAYANLKIVITHVNVSVIGAGTVDKVTAWVSNVGGENAVIIGACAYARAPSQQPCSPLNTATTPVTCYVGCTEKITTTCPSCKKNSTIIVRVFALPKRIVDEYAGGNTNLYLQYGRVAEREIKPAKGVF